VKNERPFAGCENVEVLISASQLTRRFGDFTAVDSASFEVPSGSICAILGPNGAGKSTMVKMLTGLLEPSYGGGTVCGCAIHDPRLRSMVGVLPENLALFDSLTVAEHLEFTGAVYGISKAETTRRGDQLLRVLRLEHGRNTFIGECSYGMKKKTALAAALLPNPRALFLDEPFEGIDPVTSEAIRVQLRAVAGRGITVLLTSHILSMVSRIADQIVMIRQGRIVWNSPAGELTRSVEELYFDLVESAATEDLAWLG
jgi:ABC-2 type transport system ATP-binding protein